MRRPRATRRPYCAGAAAEDRMFRRVFRRVFWSDERRFWPVLFALGCVAVVSECGGPEAVRLGAFAGGAAGSSVTGAAGVSGAAGTGNVPDAGSTGAAGDATPLTGTAGDSGAAGTAGTAGLAGTSGSTGTAGSGGSAGVGSAGMGGAAGRTSFVVGAGGGGGTTGDAGTPDAGTDAPPPGCDCALKVQYECCQNGANVTPAMFSIKIVNTGTTSVALNTVSVRYWYTIDGTGAQAGSCTSATNPCTISFQSPAATKPTADQVAVISFGGGTLAPNADTGEILIELHGSGTYNQANDYSFLDTGAYFLEDMHITGYVSGKLVWGAAP